MTYIVSSRIVIEVHIPENAPVPDEAWIGNTTLHIVVTEDEQFLKATEGDPTAYTIKRFLGQEKPWLLSDGRTAKVLSFLTMEGAQYYALHLEAERFVAATR